MYQKSLKIGEFFVFDNSTKNTHLFAMMNETEFEIFYNEQARPLWGYVRRIANSSEIADDLVQESFMRFIGSSLRDDANKKAYLYRIATNLVYDYFRRNARDIKRQNSLAAHASEEAAYEQFENESDLTESFSKLQVQERALLWLAYVEGHQHNEIAQMLGLKSLSVRVLLFRARRKLAGLIEADKREVSEV